MPNFLTIISDEHRRDAMGCVGHPLVKTPNLDWIVARGTIFSNAYAPCPMCVPVRASIACGDYVHRIRYWDSATPYDGKVRSWMHDLRDKGVHTASIGKLHFRSSNDDNGFAEEILPMHVVDGIGWTIALLRDQAPAFNGASELAGDVGEGESSYTEYDRAVTEAAEQWIRSKSKSCEPWSAFVSLVSPHYPLRAPAEYYQMYDPEAMDSPIAYSDRERPDHPEIKNIERFFSYDQYFDPKRIGEAKAAYYGLTSFMDACVGRILKALEESGQLDDTIILYVSDHGDLMGDHGMWTKQVMYEGSAAVPMLLAGPGVPRGQTVSSGCSLIDIAATARRLYGAGNGQYPGMSLIDLSRDRKMKDRTIFSEYHDGGSSTGAFMVRWKEWKFVHYEGYRPQLFNLHNDPKELEDLGRVSTGGQGADQALADGDRRLRSICDPVEVNAQCFEDQRRRIENLGGEEVCGKPTFNHTPIPIPTHDVTPTQKRND